MSQNNFTEILDVLSSATCYHCSILLSDEQIYINGSYKDLVFLLESTLAMSDNFYQEVWHAFKPEITMLDKAEFCSLNGIDYLLHIDQCEETTSQYYIDQGVRHALIKHSIYSAEINLVTGAIVRIDNCPIDIRRIIGTVGWDLYEEYLCVR